MLSTPRGIYVNSEGPVCYQPKEAYILIQKDLYAINPKVIYVNLEGPACCQPQKAYMLIQMDLYAINPKRDIC